MGILFTVNEKVQASTQESYRVSSRGEKAMTLGPEKCGGDALKAGPRKRPGKEGSVQQVSTLKLWAVHGPSVCRAASLAVVSLTHPPPGPQRAMEAVDSLGKSCACMGKKVWGPQ